MGSRPELSGLLHKLLVIKGYFQPPASVEIEYPCFLYTLDDIDAKYADDSIYHHMKRYKVTIIDTDPDSVIHERMLSLPYCSFDRTYTANNLNHWVYILYF